MDLRNIGSVGHTHTWESLPPMNMSGADVVTARLFLLSINIQVMVSTIVTQGKNRVGIDKVVSEVLDKEPRNESGFTFGEH